jgi:hypothetical protein
MEKSTENPSKHNTQPWTDFFFDEHNIVNTIQCLLLDTSRTIDDLNALCVAMIQSNTVFCLTQRVSEAFCLLLVRMCTFFPTKK